MHDNRTVERDALAIVLEGIERTFEILPHSSVRRRCLLEVRTVLRADLGDYGPMAAPDGGLVMAEQHATGYVRTIDRKAGPVYYAKLKVPDGTQPQRRLGKVWTKRTRPPAGYLTRGMAAGRKFESCRGRSRFGRGQRLNVPSPGSMFWLRWKTLSGS
jgi:hypothetical protein